MLLLTKKHFFFERSIVENRNSLQQMMKTLEQKDLEVNILFEMCKFSLLSLTKRSYHKRNFFTTTCSLKLSADVNIFEMFELFNFIVAEKSSFGNVISTVFGSS